MDDIITALAVPPGNSLTDAPGKWSWEQPPRFPNPDDAIDHAISMIEFGPAKEDMLKMMIAGVTVEELVNQISFKGFMAGAFTPDVAEIIKPAMAVFLVDAALKEGFEPNMFIDESPIEGQVSDDDFFNVLQDRNPQLYMKMNEEINKQKRLPELEQPKKNAPVERSESFLKVGEAK